MNTRQLSDKLLQKQHIQRQGTINKVLRAIANLQNEGQKITIKTLSEYTGLSRSVFAKAHIRELLVPFGYTYEKQSSKDVKPKKNTKKDDEKDQIIANLRARNKELERECELLRGRLVLVILKE